MSKYKIYHDHFVIFIVHIVIRILNFLITLAKISSVLIQGYVKGSWLSAFV